MVQGIYGLPNPSFTLIDPVVDLGYSSLLFLPLLVLHLNRLCGFLTNLLKFELVILSHIQISLTLLLLKITQSLVQRIYVLPNPSFTLINPVVDLGYNSLLFLPLLVLHLRRLLFNQLLV